ncbi:F0F1 ATP synthase subunit B [Aquimarina brevivitae]|uniref:ATP synthase subunit b n=1 Tax=Aquimarina brevivitae TaxID=323412 RepID=A0A4Q7PFK3_9FLAO|nr:F0F1 ATP synthase subunit B [Aquimarina brevivitae]RZS99256.1 ATP synthase F0 subcomplex B subunit [Aquimarina brevivitae]
MEKLINDFSFGLFFWQAVIFIGLVLLLKKYAWKPILKAVSDREEGIKSALESAEAARKEMQNLQADNERIINEARAERDTMLKEARQMKDAMIAEAKSEAQAEADKIVAQANASIENEKKAALAELKNQVAELSVEIAEKVVRNELSSKDKQMQLVETMLGDVTIN